jgi:hypothetical protein
VAHYQDEAIYGRTRLEDVQWRGMVRAAFAILGLTLPPTAGVDGVLGLDFLRGLTLTIDFRLGEITLA